MNQPLFGSLDVFVTQQVLLLRAPALDAVTHLLLSTDLRIGVLAALMFYLWIASNGTPQGNEGYIIKSVVAIVAAMFTTFVARHLWGRMMRPRLALPDLDFPPLHGLGNLADFRAFPSDTATLAGAITLVVFVGARNLGGMALAWTLLAVCFPRLYVGYHYLSDLLFGLAIGLSVAALVMTRGPSYQRWSVAFSELQARRPAAVMLGLALLAHQIGTMFPVLQFAAGAARTELQSLTAL